VFTVRYELGLHVRQYSFVLKGLKMHFVQTVSKCSKVSNGDVIKTRFCCHRNAVGIWPSRGWCAQCI